MNVTQLENKTTDELVGLMHELDIANGDVPANIMRDDALYRLLTGYAEQQGFLLASGVLEVMPDGYGFLRHNGRGTAQNDVYVSQSQVRRFNVKTGDLVLGQVRTPKESERYMGLTRVEAVNGEDPSITRRRRSFERVTPIFPEEQI